MLPSASFDFHAIPALDSASNNSTLRVGCQVAQLMNPNGSDILTTGSVPPYCYSLHAAGNDVLDRLSFTLYTAYSLNGTVGNDFVNSTWTTTSSTNFEVALSETLILDYFVYAPAISGWNMEVVEESCADTVTVVRCAIPSGVVAGLAMASIIAGISTIAAVVFGWMLLAQRKRARAGDGTQLVGMPPSPGPHSTSSTAADKAAGEMSLPRFPQQNFQPYDQQPVEYPHQGYITIQPADGDRAPPAHELNITSYAAELASHHAKY